MDVILTHPEWMVMDVAQLRHVERQSVAFLQELVAQLCAEGCAFCPFSLDSMNAYHIPRIGETERERERERAREV